MSQKIKVTFTAGGQEIKLGEADRMEDVLNPDICLLLGNLLTFRADIELQDIVIRFRNRSGQNEKG